MKKMMLCIFLILGGCTVNQKPSEDYLQYNYEAMPDEVLAFYQALDLSKVSADIIDEQGITEYTITSSEHLSLFSDALQEIDSGYLYARPQDVLYIIYQLKDKNGHTYIMESYVDGTDTYYCVNEFDLAFKVSNTQLYDILLNNNDHEANTGFYIYNTFDNRYLEQGLAKYANKDSILTKEMLMKNDCFIAELFSQIGFLKDRNAIITKIKNMYGEAFDMELPVGPIRYDNKEYTYNSETDVYDICYTLSEYIDDYVFPVVESADTVIYMRYKGNDISNLQSVIQMYGNENRYEFLSGFELFPLLLYHMNEVDLVEVNKKELTSRVIRESCSNYLLTSPISLNDFKEMNVNDEYVYLSLNAEHVAAKLFNEFMRMDYRFSDSKHYKLTENDGLIALTFTYFDQTQQNFIFSKETGITQSDYDFNTQWFNGDANAYVEKEMSKKQIPVCSGIYDEMMNVDVCYEPIKWSIDSWIQPEYRVTTTRYQITEYGELVLPVMIKKQGVFDYYELLHISD